MPSIIIPGKSISWNLQAKLDPSENWNRTDLEFRHVPPEIRDFKCKDNVLMFATFVTGRKRGDKSFMA